MHNRRDRGPVYRTHAVAKNHEDFKRAGDQKTGIDTGMKTLRPLRRQEAEHKAELSMVIPSGRCRGTAPRPWPDQ